MASPAQVLTNRNNAKRSTGPRTPEGKRASSLNSVRHGLTSQLVVLPHEDQAAFAAFEAKLLAELAPQGTVECIIAQTICHTQWRLERARKLELNLLALAQYEDIPPALAAIEDPATRHALIEAHALRRNESALRNLHIHEARLQRALFQALAQLRDAQTLRRHTAEDQMSDAIALRTAHQARELPFTPSQLGFVFSTSEIDREINRRFMLSHPKSTSGPPRIIPRSEVEKAKSLVMKRMI